MKRQHIPRLLSLDKRLRLLNNKKEYIVTVMRELKECLFNDKKIEQVFVTNYELPSKDVSLKWLQLDTQRYCKFGHASASLVTPSSWTFLQP